MRGSSNLLALEGLPQTVDYLNDVLQGCLKQKDLATVRNVQVAMVSSGLDCSETFQNQLIRFYGHCGRLSDALLLFHRAVQPSIYTWQAIISAHGTLGESDMAMDLYYRMEGCSVAPSKFILSCVVKACANMQTLDSGRALHNSVINYGFEVEVVIGTALIDMYAKCHFMQDAHLVFDTLCTRNLLSWGALITGYSQNGLGLLVLELFDKMQEEGVKPDNVIFAGIVKACGSIVDIKAGRLIHDMFLKSNMILDSVLGNALVDMYAKCGSLEEAHRIFSDLPARNILSWGAIIAGVAQFGNGFLAIELYEKMQLEGIRPNEVVHMGVLKACSNIEALVYGRMIHDKIIFYRFEMDVVVGGAIIDMYVKCGSLEEGHKVLQVSKTRDIVSWSTLIVGYAELEASGLPVISLFLQMLQEGIRPDKVTLLSALKVCGNLGAIDQGRLVHKEIIRGGFISDLTIGNTLIDMYAKCGNLHDSLKVFDTLPERDIVTWNAIIAGYAQLGECEHIRQCLNMIQQQGLDPDNKTYTSMLVGCSHGGVLEQGPHYFKSMLKNHGVMPNLEAYSSLLDLFGRAGRLGEAMDLLHSFPVVPDIVVWKSLLTSCKTYNNMELGSWCFNEVTDNNPTDAFGYMLMSNLFGDADMWRDVQMMNDMRHTASAEKKPGMAWIEVQNELHEFIAGKYDHPVIDKIYKKILRVHNGGRDDSYVPLVDLVIEPNARAGMLAETTASL